MKWGIQKVFRDFGGKRIAKRAKKTLNEKDEQYIIQTQGLCKKYGSVTALKSLDLRIPRHAICGFFGLNGAGKSTTIKILLGLARPTGGTGTIFGYDIRRESLLIRRNVGYMVIREYYWFNNYSMAFPVPPAKEGE